MPGARNDTATHHRDPDRVDIVEGPVLVVGFDREPASMAALDARDLALRCRAWLLVVHVEDLRDRPVDPEGLDWGASGAAIDG